MNIYKLTTKADTDCYDYYDSAVVVASSEDEARSIHPSLSPRLKLVNGVWLATYESGYKHLETSWAKSPDLVDVEFIGIADSRYTTPSVICASFNAG